jgi:hypothetical protein
MRFCENNTVRLCDSAGMTSTLVQSCTTTQFCDDSTGTATCVPLVCTPNMPACDGNVFTTCNATGTGYTGARTDCTTTDQTCTPSGCSDGVVDVISSAPTLYGTPLSSLLLVNIYSVTTSRTLSLVEMYLSPPAATALTWHVWESTAQTGTYTRISMTNSTSTIGTSYQASPALSVPLVALRYYAIGVSWTTQTMDFGFQSGTPTLPIAVSFGSLVSAAFPSASSAITPTTFSQSMTNYLPQRLTTAP